MWSCRTLLTISLSLVCVSSIAIDPYAPATASCPSTPLVRPATSISAGESSYIQQRRPKASAALASWLTKTNSGFNTTSLPTVVFTSSGGGYRALLTTAGVIQAFDTRDSGFGTSGLFQGFTYQAGLSGGAWFLSSFAGNNYPTISSLRDKLWKPAFADSILLAPILLSSGDLVGIEADIAAKAIAGYSPTLTDPWARSLSYQLLYGADGGVADTMSGIARGSNYTAHNVPYPIITAIGVNLANGECIPAANATQYEFTPDSFGSWDKGVAAFAQTKYLGTRVSGGVPVNRCVTGYDNLGYVLGTSSNLFNEACPSVPAATNSTLTGAFVGILDRVHELTTRDEFAVYPNPFYEYPTSPLVSSQTELTLVDGGETDQNNPIWPFLQPERHVDVLVVNDNSADTADNFPDGSELSQTYNISMEEGLTKLPPIPPSATFISEGLNKRPTFFGCNDTTKLTVIYIPNVNYTFPSNEPTLKLQYSTTETTGMIANGNQIATKGGDSLWPTCLACGIMNKAGTNLPAVCTTCFEEYCYN